MMELPIQLDSKAQLSEHFTLGEFTISKNHPEVYNIPTHEAIANLKRLCGWLEVLRERYNAKYVVPILPLSRGSQKGSEQTIEHTPEFSLDQTTPGPSYSGGEIDTILPPKLGGTQRGLNERLNNPLLRPPLAPPTSGGEINSSEPIIINSGYRSPQLNRKVGGVGTSNHLTGCAVDIRVAGKEQLLRYATILLDYADETHLDFDELLLEKGQHGKIWLHFAVRPDQNRRKIDFLVV